MMTRIPYSKPVGGLVLATLVAALGGCDAADAPKDGPLPQAAALTVLVDGSASTAFIASPAYGDAAVRRVGEAVTRQALGDRFRIVGFGSRQVENGVNVLTEESGYANRLPAVRGQVENSLRDLLAHNRQSGGQGSTNILYALENANPTCTPRSRIVILSDGIEDSETYSVNRVLAAGQPVRLPAPNTPYLRGCLVEFVGIGMAPQMGHGIAETLSNDQLKALTAGWRNYFIAAGVKPDAIRFTSIL